MAGSPPADPGGTAAAPEPPDPLADSVDLTGAWDLHVHAAPSLFPRWGDAWDLIDLATEAGMAGVLIKSHHGSTVESAALLARRSPQLSVRGGITLNGFVGGLNPIAVEAALVLGAAAVWLPTIHARQHAVACGCLGGFGFQGAPTTRVPAQGYSLLDDQGHITAEVHDILDLCHDRPTVLASGHVSEPEIAALAAAIRERSRRVKLLINHVAFSVPALDTDGLRALTDDQVWFEVAYLTVSPVAAAATIDAVAERILALPEARWIMVSDSGQVGNPPCPTALRRYAAALAGAGVSQERLRRMLVDEPARLIG